MALIKKKKFYSTEKLDKLIREKDVKIAMINGGRNIGKSYAIKKRMIDDAWQNENNKFIYLRRYVTDIKTFYCEKYFSVKVWKEYILDLTNGEYDRILFNRNTFYFGKMEDSKRVYGRVCGYSFAIANDERMKSLELEDVKNAVFEEWQTDGRYLYNEPDRVLSITSTIKRNRNDFCFFMIANLINVVSPYIKDWGLQNIERQKQNTVDLYEQTLFDENGIEKDKFVVAVEYCGERDVQYEINGTGGSTYKTKKHNIISIQEISKFNSLYEFYVEYDTFRFWLRLYERNGISFLYCLRKTSAIKDANNKRIVGNNFYFSNLYSKGFMKIIEVDDTVFRLIDRGMVFYSDDFTGEKFEYCVKMIKGM